MENLELKNKIGETWENLSEMCEDLECCMESIVEFGEISKTPFSSSKKMEIYNLPSEDDKEDDFEEESYILEFLETEDRVELLGVY